MFGWVSVHQQEPTPRAQNESIERETTKISGVDATDNVSVPRKLIELQVEVFKSLKRACDQQRHILQEFGLTDFEPLDPESSIEQERIEEADIPSEVHAEAGQLSIPRMQPQMPTRGEGGVFSPPSRAGAKHDDHKRPNGEPAADGLGGGVNSNNSNAAHVHSGYADEMEINQRAVNVGNELDGAAGLGIKKTVGAGIDGSLKDITTDQAILKRSFNGWASLLATIKKKDRLDIVESQGVKQGIFGNFIDRMRHQ
jgi:hypothetical protein